MKLSYNRGVSIDSLFYMGMLLITFDSFPFSRYGLGSGKPLSVIPLMIYVVIKFFSNSKYRNFNINTILTMLAGVLLLADSLFHGVYIYNDLAGFSRAFNMFAVFYITTLSFTMFVKSSNQSKIRKMFIYIYKSFSISLIFGILEIVYFYVYPSNIIREFVLLFVRDDVYISLNKVQYNFGESGNTAIMLACLFPLVLVCLKRLNYKFTKVDYLKIGLIYLISIQTFSVNYLLIVLVLILGFIIIGDGKHKPVQLICIGLTIIGAFIFFAIIGSSQFKAYAMQSDLRLLPMLADASIIFTDGSIQTRLGSSQISLISFTKQPLFGYGWGYYAHAFRENFNGVNELFKSWELIGDLAFDDLQNFGFIFALLSEGGVLGIVFFACLIARIKNMPVFLKPFLIAILFEMLQCIFIYWISLIVAFYICTDKKIGELIKNNKGEYI